MRDLLADLRYAARSLLARPSFTISAVLTLALAIGMTTSVFSFLDGVVLRPLPLRDAGRLIVLCEQFPGASPDWCSAAPPNIEEVKARSRTIEALGLGRGWSFTLATPTGRENLNGGLASEGMFEALGIRPQQGRLIERADLLGRPSRVAVISDEMWHDRFGGGPGVVGRSLTLDGEPVTIVGILEKGAAVPLFERVEIWRPLHIDPRDEQHREWRGFVVYGRLRPGISMKAARQDLSGIVSDLRRAHFSTTPGWDIVPQRLHDRIVGNVRPALLLFLGAVTLVLLIASANVANLVLARGAQRARELAIRAALGASRARIVRVLVLESLVLALLGAGAGIALSTWSIPVFRALAPAGIPRLDQVHTNSTVLAFTALVAVVTAAIFGLIPALRASRVDMAQSLRDGGRSGTIGRGNIGRLLVIAEVAIALPLVTTAALLSRSFVAQMRWQPGFEREHLLTFSMMFPSDAYPKKRDLVPILERLEREISGVPGVRAVGTSSGGPLFGSRESSEMEIEGLGPNDRRSIRWFDVNPGFFATLGVPIVRGSDFDERDVLDAPSSGLVNETLANRFWPGQNPIGKHLTFVHGQDRETYTVRGVVRDVPPVRPGATPEPELYWSNRQAPRWFTYFVVRTTVPPTTVTSAIRDRIKSVNGDFSPSVFRPMSDRLDSELRVPKFSMMLNGVFGIAALVLAGIGTYGLLAYVVEQRRRDIGIQMALGAQRRQIVDGVLRRGLGLAIPGIVIGIAGAAAMARLIRTYLAGVSAFDPVSLLLSCGFVIVVALVACLVPAIRASRVDPAVTLVAD